jgi:adenylate cyclase
MARNITYEIMVQQGTRWEIHARHGAAKKDAALNEAKALERLPKITAVKVIKETYNTEDGDTHETTIYKSDAGPNKYELDSGDLDHSPSSPSPFGRPRRGSSRARGVTASAPRPTRTAPSTRMGIFTRILLVIFFSIAFAALVTGLMALVMRDFSLFGFRVSSDVYANILFGVFVIGFLISAIPLSFKFLSTDGLSSSAARRRPNRVTAKPARKPSKKENKSAMLDEEPPPPSIEAEDQPTDKEPAEEEKAEEKEEEPAEEEQPPAGELSSNAETQKVYMMTFLGQALEHVKTASKSMDNFNKFGVNLFLAGACEAMSSDRDLDDEDSAVILGGLVEVMGFKKDQATSFANKCEEYLLADSRYMQMYQAGRNSMNTFIGGDDEGAKQLHEALVEWDKPKAKEADTGPITVMFTDMVGSTALTQMRGDEVAQQVVRTHNRIVRDALNTYGGREIKHTGDGIMCSFPTTSNGVEAAISIQQKTATHNESNADLPLHLKIGINAGEPIVEDDDLFGSTVQLAARIVDKASSEEIYVSEIVRGICAGKDFKFSNQGGFDMKGFDDPITLFEVLWEVGETEMAAVAPAATPAKPKQEAPEVKGPSSTQKPAAAVPTGATAKPSPVTQPAQPEVPAATPPAVPTSGASMQETTKH